MSHAAPAVTGFDLTAGDDSWLYTAVPHTGSLREAGLASPARWTELLGSDGRAPGRGETARVTLGGTATRLKQLRRGGLAAGLWGHDRFPGTARPLDNLRLPQAVLERGIPTAACLALLLVRAGAGDYRAWLAVEELAGAVDLATAHISGAKPSHADLAAVMQAVRRMHDCGLEHRDLNLGNLLVRHEGAGREVYVIDLDRARLHAGALSFRLRQRSLRRLERSYVKIVGGDETTRSLFYSLYAGDDPILAAKLDRGRAAGRVWIELHRLGWRNR